MSHAITRNAILPSVHVSVPQERANQVFVTDDGGGPQAAVTRKFLKQHPEWHLEDEKEQDWSKFHGTVLDACYGTLHSLKSVAAAPTFTGLTVLCLKETGLADIMLLESCRMLVHLDLSSNEISHVPCDDFWTSFPDMLVLLLHGNKVRPVPFPYRNSLSMTIKSTVVVGGRHRTVRCTPSRKSVHEYERAYSSTAFAIPWPP